MQAIILAGGYGTRLHPLTLNAPKPMVPIGGRPMVDYLIDKLDVIGEFSQIFIVTNQKFAHIFDAWKEEKKRNDIIVVNDGTTSPDNRLGSLGDIQFVINNHSIDEDVLILGGDNFFEDDLRGLLYSFTKHGDTI
jgi:glucose-1-phosphate thymidylyltransferase